MTVHSAAGTVSVGRTVEPAVAEPRSCSCSYSCFPLPCSWLQCLVQGPPHLWRDLPCVGPAVAHLPVVLDPDSLAVDYWQRELQRWCKALQDISPNS